MLGQKQEPKGDLWRFAPQISFGFLFGYNYNRYTNQSTKQVSVND